MNPEAKQYEEIRQPYGKAKKKLLQRITKIQLKIVTLTVLRPNPGQMLLSADAAAVTDESAIGFR